MWTDTLSENDQFHLPMKWPINDVDDLPSPHVSPIKRRKGLIKHLFFNSMIDYRYSASISQDPILNTCRKRFVLYQFPIFLLMPPQNRGEIQVFQGFFQPSNGLVSAMSFPPVTTYWPNPNLGDSWMYPYQHTPMGNPYKKRPWPLDLALWQPRSSRQTFTMVMSLVV